MPAQDYGNLTGAVVRPDEDVMAVKAGGRIVIQTGGMILPNDEAQPANIADAVAITGGQDPTEAEFNDLLGKVNAILAVLRGAGLIAPS